MNFQLQKHYLLAWGRNLFGLRTVWRTSCSILSCFGVLWLIIEVTNFFFQNKNYPDLIRNHWYVFLSVGLIYAAWVGFPKRVVSCKLAARDITLEVAIGDMFDYPGALIVGTNTTFDTRLSRELISEKSVQGVFTRKYYGDETQLDAEISSGLKDIPYEELPGDRIGKKNKYLIGTVVRLYPKKRTAYLTAIADINEHGVASGSFDGLKDAIAKLWAFIGKRGLKESLVIPVLGSGSGRVTQSREEIVREIIQSFIAACSEATFCDKLTIVLAPRDVEIYRIDLNELGLFLQHLCKYTNFAVGQCTASIGTSLQ